MIEASGLTKAYGSNVVVRGVSFEVPRGQIAGFLGPNGAGKSTTMKMLACYLPPSGGTAKVAGFDVFEQSMEVRKRLGYLPENVPLYMEMRVREYLDFRGRLRGMDRKHRQSRMETVLERCWLKDVREKTIGHLSKGYRQRVGLADSLLHNPEVLILDEPTVGLDPAQIRETRKLIQSLAADHTVLLSTHILPEVEAVCQQVIVIARGEVVAQGTLDELRRGHRGSGDGGSGIGGGGRVVLECRASAQDVLAGVRLMGEVERAEVMNESGGAVSVAVYGRDGAEFRPQLAKLAAEKGWPLLQLKTDTRTLEEFFVEVTARQAQQMNQEVA